MATATQLPVQVNVDMQASLFWTGDTSLIFTFTQPGDQTLTPDWYAWANFDFYLGAKLVKPALPAGLSCWGEWGAYVLVPGQDLPDSAWSWQGLYPAGSVLADDLKIHAQMTSAAAPANSVNVGTLDMVLQNSW